jgi:hypothetical protein
MVSIIQSYQIDNAEVHITEVLYHTISGACGTRAPFATVGYERTREVYGEVHSHTVAVLIDGSMKLPDFSLKSIAGITVPVQGRCVPRQRLEFSDVGEFAKNLELHCWNTEACRLVFSKALRRKLASKRGLTDMGSGGKPALFHRNGVCVDRNLDSFIQDANEGFAQVRPAECLIREKQEYNPVTEVQHLLDAFAKQPGIRQFTRQIEAHHLDALEASKLPCEITKAIRSKVLAFSWIPLFISLALIPLTLFPSLFIAQDSGGQRLVNVICALGASAFVAVTGTLF